MKKIGSNRFFLYDGFPDGYRWKHEFISTNCCLIVNHNTVYFKNNFKLKTDSNSDLQNFFKKFLKQHLKCCSAKISMSTDLEQSNSLFYRKPTPGHTTVWSTHFPTFRSHFLWGCHDSMNLINFKIHRILNFRGIPLLKKTFIQYIKFFLRHNSATAGQNLAQYEWVTVENIEKSFSNQIEIAFIQVYGV